MEAKENQKNWIYRQMALRGYSWDTTRIVSKLTVEQAAKEKLLTALYTYQELMGIKEEKSEKKK